MIRVPIALSLKVRLCDCSVWMTAVELVASIVSCPVPPLTARLPSVALEATRFEFTVAVVPSSVSTVELLAATLTVFVTSAAREL